MRKMDRIEDLAISREFLLQWPQKREDLVKCISTFSPTWSRSQVISRLKTITRIAKNNEEVFPLYEEYISCNSTKRKIEIVDGQIGVEEYLKRLSRRPRPVVVSHFSKQYWINQGHSIDESAAIISEMARNNTLKRSRESYNINALRSKLRVDYWVNLGYSIEQAEILREPHLQKCKNNLSGMIERHGEESGTKKYLARVAKYKQSMIDNLPSRRGCGYVSKESIKFFIPIYKFCRRLGIAREDICLGVGGSREFFIQDKSFDYNTGKFYDFTIKSLKMIIEYHGTYWHPRDIETWKNPTDFHTAFSADQYKEKLAIDRGMEYNIVWSDCNKTMMYDTLTSKIRTLYDSRLPNQVL